MRSPRIPRDVAIWQQEAAEALRAQGVTPPFPLYNSAEVHLIAGYLADPHHPKPEWFKGRAACEPFMLALGRHPLVNGLLQEVLGPDIILWGASGVTRRPRQVHHWHTDIESASPQGGFLTLWTGVRNTSRGTRLKYVSGSHRFGVCLQEALHRRGLHREEVADDEILDAARDLDADAKLQTFTPDDGEAILFDGRIWHGTANESDDFVRQALLLQYARGDIPVRRPDLQKLDWPIRLLDTPRPPVIVISGNASSTTNRLVRPPGPKSELSRSSLPAEEFAMNPGWSRQQGFSGSAGGLTVVSCHRSQLIGPEPPHPPHAHIEEELLVVTQGEAEILLASGEDDPAPRRERLSAGGFAYYPPYQWHTLRNCGSEPLRYTMIKWQGAFGGRPEPLGVRVVPAPAVRDKRRMRRLPLLDGPTLFLAHLHCHLTEIDEGAGYAAHQDSYHVALVCLEGALSCENEILEPGGAVFYCGGQEHGLRAVKSSRYLAFEFHERKEAKATDAKAVTSSRSLFLAAEASVPDRLRSRVASAARAAGFRVSELRPSAVERAGTRIGLGAWLIRRKLSRRLAEEQDAVGLLIHPEAPTLPSPALHDRRLVTIAVGDVSCVDARRPLLDTESNVNGVVSIIDPNGTATEVIARNCPDLPLQVVDQRLLGSREYATALARTRLLLLSPNIPHFNEVFCYSVANGVPALQLKGIAGLKACHEGIPAQGLGKGELRQLRELWHDEEALLRLKRRGLMEFEVREARLLERLESQFRLLAGFSVPALDESTGGSECRDER